MATISIIIKSKKPVANLYLRFQNGRGSDFQIPTPITVLQAHWDFKKQKLRNIATLENRDSFNLKLSGMKNFVLEKYNDGYMNGEIIDKRFIHNKVSDFFNRPNQEKKGAPEHHKIYLSDFSRWWIREKSKMFGAGMKRKMSERSIKNYENAISEIEEFEGKDKIRLRDCDNEKLQEFADWLNEKKFQPSTVEKKASRILFFLNRAVALKFSVHSKYKEDIYLESSQKDYKEQYFNEEEIKRIYNWDFSYSERLDNCRDLLILSLRSGLRISDFNNNMNTDCIDQGFIEVKTKKTRTWVSIPIHADIEQILKKRNGAFPEHISDSEYNKTIKEIAFVCEFDEYVKGAVYKKVGEVNRKVFGTYKRYELVCSHIGRRSFATLLFGKIPNTDLMAICGWSSEKMMLHYIQKSNRESAEVLKSYWENKY